MYLVQDARNIQPISLQPLQPSTWSTFQTLPGLQNLPTTRMIFTTSRYTATGKSNTGESKTYWRDARHPKSCRTH